MQTISFDNTGFEINGQEAYLVSGEFPYFRVPREDWKRRMQLFKDTGGNCLATYVPWVIHEPEEGNILFDDVPYRDLSGFLRTAQEMDLQVMLRPGPYQYSELVNAGIPTWLLENYPEILAVDIHGKPIRDYAASYIHPVLLEKARKYYRAFADVVRPFMVENGGPVTMLQVDNELSGIHLWSNSMDYNPDSMGFGREDGRYAKFLRRKYETIQKLNAAYGTCYQRFALVKPVAHIDRADVGQCRQLKDYSEFYRTTMAEYLTTLAGWLREDGLGGLICHNSGTPSMNCLFTETIGAMGEEKFLLASDHYYNLDQTWGQNNPTPQYAIRVLMSCDTLRALGMPPVAMELPAGSCSNTPPILANDMLACHMTNTAVGLKGSNYYIFTGGPNVPGTGASCDIYDYDAPVHADGSLNQPNYDAVTTYGHFLRDHSWMQKARRTASVQIGFEWNTQQCDNYDYTGLPYGGADAGRFIEKGLLYSLMCSKYSGEMVLLTGELDVNRPLIVPCPSAMSAEAQKAVVDFVERGGSVMILPVLPETDLEYNAENTLRTLFDGVVFGGKKRTSSATTIDGVGRVFGVHCHTVCEKLPENAKVIATDDNGTVLGYVAPHGKGKILWLGATWLLTTFPQAKMMERFVELLGGERCVESSNRNIFTTLWMDDEGRRQLFVMNLYSSPQTTDIHVHMGGDWSQQMSLAPMEVRSITL